MLNSKLALPFPGVAAYPYLAFMPAPGFTPRKRLGQHFLADPNIARKIVDALDPRPGEHVLEIGPGNGALTEILLPRVSRLTAVDVDPRAIEALRSRFAEAGEKLTLLCADILTYAFAPVGAEGMLRVVGNLPYNITTPILFRLVDERWCVRDAVVMMQREVAERICAPPGTKEYGILSVLLRTHAEASILFPVSRNVFFPKPRVASSVLSLRFTEERIARIADYPLFRRIVRGVFAARRKTLANGLRRIGIDPERAPESFRSMLARRPEQLAPEDFAALANGFAPLLPAAESAAEAD